MHKNGLCRGRGSSVRSFTLQVQRIALSGRSVSICEGGPGLRARYLRIGVLVVLIVVIPAVARQGT
jgi:hypothetical protein